jgi:hypothetical protein
MKGKLLADAGQIKKGAPIDIDSKVSSSSSRRAEDAGGESATEAPVYAVSDHDGHHAHVDARDIVVSR